MRQWDKNWNEQRRRSLGADDVKIVPMNMPSRDFFLGQAVLNVKPADWWKWYLTPAHEADLLGDSKFYFGLETSLPSRIRAEYRKLVEGWKS